jgi:opacity protein-like surface antigen
MRALTTTLLILLTFPAASFAQTRGYANLAGGFAVSSDTTSGDVVGEAGVRVAPHLFVFGNLGRFENVQPSAFQPAVDATTATLATGGLAVTGTARVPAWYTMGGVRWIVPASTKIAPYVFGGAGLARVTDTATFTYSSGTLPGVTPVTGDDVTQQLVSLGDYVQPAASNAFMLSVGGGVQAPIAPRLVLDVGYRVSRISTDTPFNAQSVTFGFGYKF